jgi:hypothetical protein
LREFRRARPWLRGNLGPRDHFTYRAPTDGMVVFRSYRVGPDGEEVFAVAHLEGKPLEDCDPLHWGVPGTEGGGWELALRSPPIGAEYQGGPLTLRDGMGMVFVRRKGQVTGGV